jgi:YVTN family beta-propeller protein
MKILILPVLALLCLGSGHCSQAQELLVLETKIPLGEVKGRIDHLAVDLGRNRLFVAELGNNSVGVVDLDQRKVIRVISGLKEPQGVGFVPSSDTLYVANGGDGTVQLFRGLDFDRAGQIDLGDDADNIRVDPVTSHVFVGYGKGALAVVDPVSRSKIADIILSGHPESFQLDKASSRIFVNVPTKQTIQVEDRATRMQLAVWPSGNGTQFAMALNDEAHHLLVALRVPAKINAFSMESGSPITGVETCGDIDDMFVDAKRRRLYVSCGEGFVDIFDSAESAYRRLARIATVPGARTSLFVPEIDRLFVAARAGTEQPAAVWVLRPAP